MSGCVEEKEGKVDNQGRVVRFKIRAARAVAKKQPADETVKQAHDLRPAMSVEDKRENRNRVKKEGIYTVKKGESLYSIAKKEDVYGNPLKWISLFRLNFERLKDAVGAGDIRHEILKEGMELRYITPKEAEKALSHFQGKGWVVNVLSSQVSGKIVPAATALIKEGYKVYISEARVRGKNWLRLRIGFYGDSSEAAKDSRKIMSIAGVNDAWVTKADEKEIREYGGF